MAVENLPEPLETKRAATTAGAFLSGRVESFIEPEGGPLRLVEN